MMPEHFNLVDLEPASYEDAHYLIGSLLLDQCISPYTEHNFDLPCHLSDDITSSRDDSSAMNWPKSTAILNWSFGFSTDYVSNMLQRIPVNLKHKLNGMCVEIEARTKLDACTRNQNDDIKNYSGRCPTENYMLTNDETNDQLAFLKMSIDKGLSFNSKLADIWSLDWADRQTKIFGHGTAFPFHIVDYLCIIVHDIDSLFQDVTIRYCRVMSPNAAPPSAQLVCMLTRRKFESSGALAQVHPQRHARSFGPPSQHHELIQADVIPAAAT
jgi:hypothetical protein